MTQTSDRLKAFRERNKPKKDIIEPVINGKDSKFATQRWYDKITLNPDIVTIKQAAEYYDAAVEDGKYYVVPVGNLETLLEQYPGITFYYQSILVDVQQSRRWLEERIARLEATKYNYYMHDSESRDKYGVLKTTEASKLAKGDSEVIAMADSICLLAFHEHNLDNLMQAFEHIKYVLNHVVNIHKENLQEVWVDPTKETVNA